MKKLIALLLLFTPFSLFASPYAEYKNELKFKNTHYSKDIHHLRLGYAFEKFYVEAGPRTDGYASEVGYKLKKGPLIFKGKWEGSKTNDFDHKLETEVRYTWD